MKNDTNTIEHNNYMAGVAGLLSKYGYATVTSDNIGQLLNDLSGLFGIKAYVVPRPNEKDNHYFIKEEK